MRTVGLPTSQSGLLVDEGDIRQPVNDGLKDDVRLEAGQGRPMQK